MEMNKKQFIILLFSTCIAAFFGAYIAFRAVTMPPPPPPAIMDTNDLAKQSEDFMNQPPMPADFMVFGNSFLNAGNVTSIKTIETKDSYLIKINLKPFNNDPKNVDVKVKGKHISISANYKSKNENQSSSSQFYQSLTLPSKIDDKSVVQKREGDFLVITIPKK